MDGVRKGSLLGPTIFICYINDIRKCDFESGASIYADNTVIYVTDKSKDVLESKMTGNLKKLVQWSVDSRLTINPCKTRCMIFNYKKNFVMDDLSLGIEEIPLTRGRLTTWVSGWTLF